jgi:hypothetical protein
MDLHNVGMLQPGDGLRLGAKTRQLLGVEVFPGQDHLQGHGAVEVVLPGPVHHPHAPAADDLQELVARHDRGVQVGAEAGGCGDWLRGQGGGDRPVQLDLSVEFVSEGGEAACVFLDCG